MPVSSRHNGWRYDPANSRLDFYYLGTRLGHISALNLAVVGNVRIGAISTFGTTEPTSSLVMKSGTAFAGAIATSGGIGSTDTILQKIVAAGTVSNIET